MADDEEQLIDAARESRERTEELRDERRDDEADAPPDDADEGAHD
jgi:hypothetical protein